MATLHGIHAVKMLHTGLAIVPKYRDIHIFVATLHCVSIKIPGVEVAGFLEAAPSNSR